MSAACCDWTPGCGVPNRGQRRGGEKKTQEHKQLKTHNAMGFGRGGPGRDNTEEIRVWGTTNTSGFGEQQIHHQTGRGTGAAGKGSQG